MARKTLKVKAKQTESKTEQKSTATGAISPLPTHHRPRAARVETPKISDLNSKQQVHGNIEEVMPSFSYLKSREFPYKEKTFAEYQTAISKMTRNQLNEELMRINRIPTMTDHKLIIATLEKVYLEKQASFLLKYSKSMEPNTNGVDGERAERIVAILNR